MKKTSKKTPSTQLPKWVVPKDYRWALDYTVHDEEGDDHEKFCDMICRCRTIYEVKINSVSASSIVESISNVKPKTLVIPKEIKELFEYALNRVVTHSGALKTDKWEVHWGQGYYGEEVTGSTLDYSVVQTLQATLDTLLSDLSPRNLMETTLIAEYGYLLPGLEKRDWSIESIPRSKVIAGMPLTYDRVNKDVVKAYALRPKLHIPVAVVLQEEVGDKFNLIDGRHRFLARRNQRMIRAVVAV